MDNNQPADISDERLLAALKKAIADFPPRHSEAEALNVMEYSLALELRKARAVAALAREGWRPIPKNEGFPMTLHQPRSNPCPLVETAADGEAEQLAKQLQELAGILESLQIPQWPGRVLRAAELLVRQQALASVPAFPPRPPVTKGHNNPTGLTRWGIQWNGPEQAIALPMDDGYWTPWHVADELLRQALANAPAPVLTRERPWEREGWCDEQGRCWMGDPGGGKFIPSWRLCSPWDFCNLKWSLPHWAIPVPALGDAS